MKKEQKKSPLKEESLRMPGQHLRNKINKIIDEEFFPAYGVASMAILFAIQEWIYFIFGPSRELHPWVFTLIAVVISIGAYTYFLTLKKKALNYRLGYDGEVFVGQLLEGFRAKGFTPIHDVPCENNGRRFNIDHVLIGPKGVFAIETKTWRKKWDEKINYVNGRLLIGTHTRDSESIFQAQRNARWIEGILFKHTGEHVLVSPILLFPGWYVEKIATSEVKNEHGVLMRNPKFLDGDLEVLPNTLNNEQVDRFVSTISAYVHREAIREKDQQW